MELRHIQSFVLVARHGSFSRAAAALGLAQPALSLRIKQLEEELGVRLVDRATRPLRLTEAGLAFQDRAERIVAEADLAHEEMQALAGLEGGKVVVGALAALASIWLPPVVARFVARHPGVRVTVRERNTEELARLLGTGQLDLAVLHEVPELYPGTGRYPGLQVEQLFDEELVVVVAPDHPLAGRRSTTLEQLRNEPWVFVARGSGLAHSLGQALDGAGFEPRVAARCDSQATLRALVAAGVGISIIPRLPAEAASPALAVLRLRPALAAHTTAVAWRRDSRLSNAGEAFLAVVREHAGRRAADAAAG